MNLENFNINKILKNSDPKQRAIIFFDDIAKELFGQKNRLKNSEREEIYNSFQSREETNIYNQYYRFFDKSCMAICEIEKRQNKIDHLQYMLVAAITEMGSKYEMIDQTINILDEILAENLIAKNKKKEFALKSATLIANFDEQIIPEFIYKMLERESEKEADNDKPNTLILEKSDESYKSEENMKISQIYSLQHFVQIIKARIIQQLETIQFCQKYLKTEYEEIGIKLTGFSEKISKIDEDIAETKEFIDGFCRLFEK